jgi:hypothetical protein
VDVPFFLRSSANLMPICIHMLHEGESVYNFELLSWKLKLSHDKFQFQTASRNFVGGGSCTCLGRTHMPGLGTLVSCVRPSDVTSAFALRPTDEVSSRCVSIG